MDGLRRRQLNSITIDDFTIHDQMSTSQIKSPASRRLKFQLVFTVVFVAVGLLLTWLILGDGSPFHEYFIWHVGLPNLWVMTVFVPFALAAVLSGNPHSPPMVIVVLFLIIQWLIVGLIISIPLSRLWLRLQKYNPNASLR